MTTRPSNRLFLPLGMSHTHFRDDHAEIVKDMAYAYAYHNGRGNRIRFTRDAQGKITGALLNTFRVYNFRFERSP
jgi:YD repeat-containing protein